MQHKKSFAAGVLALAALAAMPAARAGDFYLVGAVGQSRATDLHADTYDSAFRNAGVQNLKSSGGNTDLAYKLQAGYAFTRNWAVEGGYFNLGQADYNASGTYLGYPINANATVKADGWNLSGVGTLPLSDRWAVFGKLGVAFATVTADYSVGGGGAGRLYGRSASSNDVTAVYGLGATYSLNRYFSLRAEYEIYNQVGNNDTGKSGVNVMSVGAMYKF